MTWRLRLSCRLPVGSSANTSCGRWASARAIATRCYCVRTVNSGRAARQYLDRALEQRFQPQHGHQFVQPLVAVGQAVQAALEQQVVVHVQAGQKVELLEYETEVAAPHRGEIAFLHPREFLAHDPNFAGIGRLEPGCDLQQRALAVSAGAQQCQAVGKAQRQVHAAQHLQLALAIVKRLLDTAKLERGTVRRWPGVLSRCFGHSVIFACRT